MAKVKGKAVEVGISEYVYLARLAKLFELLVGHDTDTAMNVAFDVHEHGFENVFKNDPTGIMSIGSFCENVSRILCDIANAEVDKEALKIFERFPRGCRTGK
jgi:hypothetical protein